MDKLILKAEDRKVFGRKVKKLRKEGLLPANIFGKKVKSKSVQVDSKEFQETYKQSGETGIIELAVGTEKIPALVHGIQLNPKSEELLHVDFFQVDLKEKVEANVPVELIGESPAEKQAMGTVVQYINEITVEALPMDLPEKFEVDTSLLSEVDQAVYVKDLKVDSGKVSIQNDGEDIVAKVEPPQKIEEEPIAPSEVAEGETPATDEAKPESSEEAPVNQE
jgi:large subunit ribosomal protein L25